MSRKNAVNPIKMLAIAYAAILAGVCVCALHSFHARLAAAAPTVQGVWTPRDNPGEVLTVQVFDVSAGPSSAASEVFAVWGRAGAWYALQGPARRAVTGAALPVYASSPEGTIAAARAVGTASLRLACTEGTMTYALAGGASGTLKLTRVSPSFGGCR